MCLSFKEMSDMDIPKDLKYTKEHEWIKLDGESVIVGISDFAQDALGDIVFIELPKVGDKLEQNKGAGVV
jgi:glycine cleavage system H protein